MSAASLLDPPRAFLGVTSSILGRPWRDRCADAALQAYAATMVQAHGLPDLLARVLAGRGITPGGGGGLPAAAPARSPARPHLPRRHGGGRRAPRPGVAGPARPWRSSATTTSTGPRAPRCSPATCAAFGLTARIHIPDRITEGYGPNVAAVTALARRGATLLVTVDCGTSRPRAACGRRSARPRRDRARPPRRPGAAAAGLRHRQSEPPRRPLGPRPPLRGRRGLPHPGGPQPAPAR